MLFLNASAFTAPKRRKIALFLTLLLTLNLFFFVFVNARLTPLVLALGEEKAKQITLSAIDEALEKTLGDTQELFSVQTDSTGRATLVSCDTAAANRLRSQVSETLNHALTNQNSAEFQIPLGNLFPLPLFSGRGPKITAHLLPISVATVTLTHDFLSSGINQTLFTLSCEVEVTVRLVTPLSRDTSTLLFSCPIAQLLTPGSVPGVYVERS